jgi:hypothetical protein
MAQKKFKPEPPKIKCLFHDALKMSCICIRPVKDTDKLIERCDNALRLLDYGTDMYGVEADKFREIKQEALCQT